MGLHKVAHWALAGILTSLLGSYLINSGLFDPSGIILWRFGLGVLILLYSLLCYYISYNNPAESHSIITVFISVFYMLVIGKLHGSRARKTFYKQTRNCKATQETLLREIIKENGQTKYGKDHDLDKITTLDDLRDQHPLTEYKHYQSYVERIMEGEQNVMTKDKIVFFGLSSGTTGKNKMFPVPSKFKAAFMQKAGIMMNTRAKEMSNYWNRAVMLRWKNSIRYSPCGIPMSSVSQHLYPVPIYTVSPKCTFQLGVEKTCLYIHALFALKEPEIGYIDGFMTPIAYSFFKNIVDNVDQLCMDIETGKVDANLDIPDDIRRQLNKALSPDPIRAAFVREEVAEGADGLGKRLWPKLGFVAMTSTGSFAHYGKLLESSFLRGVPFGSFAILSSEAFTGYLLFRETPTCYTLAIDSTVFEFIREEDIPLENPDTYFAHQLNTGESYEIVVTTVCGLYRYRLGDVIEVVDYLNETPIFEFKYRVGQLLNVTFEKTPEHIFYQAMESGEKSLNGVTVADYTAVESSIIQDIKGSHSESKHYYLFVETEKDGLCYLLSEVEKRVFDQSLCDLFENYRGLRQKGSISPMEVIQVKSCTFARLASLMKKDYVNSQFKMPRALRNPTFLKFLLENVISNNNKSTL